ncbi:Os05g0202800 [Oryza sativa Japonica Group]|uniref:Os05g0202800 protein n=1 Tax=Oryza sativa subsp. japonica TaxID=39947 RepID=C7J2H3_ORYSJ|nr:Os05g0202800 [Oryza sativa Japonica Group]|eukprot:NP_001174271.1 Os05g0202800 [Oryza sativa Japonica Group]
MSDKCGNCDCADKSQCVKKGTSYGVVIVDAEKRATSRWLRRSATRRTTASASAPPAAPAPAATAASDEQSYPLQPGPTIQCVIRYAPMRAYICICMHAC